MGIQSFVPSSGGGMPGASFIASVQMVTYNRSWAQVGGPGDYALVSSKLSNGYAYFVSGGVTTGVPLGNIINLPNGFTRIDIVAPKDDYIMLYKVATKTTTEFANPFAAFSSFPSIITASGNFVLPNNALPLVNVQVVGAGGSGGHHGGGGGGGGGIVKLTAYQAVGTTSVTVGSGGQGDRSNGGTSYFGNVYALGGGGAGGHGDNQHGSGANYGAVVANGGGAGSHSPSNTGGTGTVQTTSTGLGIAGTPTYLGGHRGGNYSGGANWNYVGAGGGGAAGNGGDRSSSTDTNSGGPGHVSDISGTNVTYSVGGGGASHSPGRDGNTSNTYGSGGGGYHTSSNTPGRTGAVIVRYYIP